MIGAAAREGLAKRGRLHILAFPSGTLQRTST